MNLLRTREKTGRQNDGLPKMFLSKFSEAVNMLLYMARKKMFADIINLRILRWNGILGWPNLNTRLLTREGRKVKVRGKDMKMEVEVKVRQPQAKKCRQFPEAEKHKEQSPF